MARAPPEILLAHIDYGRLKLGSAKMWQNQAEEETRQKEGEKPGKSKLDKAAKFGIPEIGEEELLKLIGK